MIFDRDPVEGLLGYIEDIKPYHTKILDILVEHVYTENLTPIIEERLLIETDITLIDTIDTSAIRDTGYRTPGGPQSVLPGGTPYPTVFFELDELTIIDYAIVKMCDNDEGNAFDIGGYGDCQFDVTPDNPLIDVQE